MASEPFAFSVHNFISSVGADAGFAAIIGLAVLVLLYFAHARETANLREEAAMLTQRLQQAEARVAQLSRMQPPASAPTALAPASAPTALAPARTPTAPAPEAFTLNRLAGAAVGDVAATPFAPAGVGAPALAAATRVMPGTHQAPVRPRATPAPQPALTAAASQPVMAAAAPSATATLPKAAAPASGSPPPGSPPAAGSATPVASPQPAVPAPATAAGSNGAGHEPAVGSPSRRTASAPPRAQPRPVGTGASRQLPPFRDPVPRRSSSGRRLAVAIGALGLVGVAAALVIATSVGAGSTSSSSAARTSNAPAPTRSRAVSGFAPSAVTVAVLNGTATNQLAHRVAEKLTGAGYREGRIATASNQTQNTSVVAYLPGADNRNDALHVATALRLGPGAVQPIDQSTQQVACPPPSACTANVVVTVGADLATL